MFSPCIDLSLGVLIFTDIASNDAGCGCSEVARHHEAANTKGQCAYIRGIIFNAFLLSMVECSFHRVPWSSLAISTASHARRWWAPGPVKALLTYLSGGRSPDVDDDDIIIHIKDATEFMGG